jgi:[acyl-carrier-protein] S-malonyltransferase
MMSACDRLQEVLKSVSIKTPRIPVISNVDAKPHQGTDRVREILIRQVTQPVLWEDCVREMLAQGCTQFYEIGPGKVLKSLLKRIDRKIECQTINDDQ